MNVSNFSFIAKSLNSKLFIDKLYNKIIINNNLFNFSWIKKKKILFYKWSFFRKNLIKNLVTILNKNIINRYYKIALKWKINKILTVILQKNIKFFYVYYVSLFNFFVWNRIVLLRNKLEYNRYFLKEWKVLKVFKEIIFIQIF